ncbi:FkbM family methyltransferase [Raineya orbicola]|jgi:FkbM family methyltransferase|uniref:Methyltransferase, FkbM family n=1 Tax=Raineya orbicola TaxID=2016530 RepID=A0A2N3IHT8_9BACT|nr:FkbM family methyltransferase [Raineya orbicola]PKQ69864.1 Methyltransferase, FkbM family [Raineya orbicola]
MNKGAIRLYRKLKEKGYSPKNICEVGVYLPEESNVISFIKEGVSTSLIEADPEYVRKIEYFFSEYPNVKVIETAIFDFNGTIELCKREASTFVSVLEKSPAIVNDNCKKEDSSKITVNCVMFSEIDRGDFDLVSIDIEGAEWYVIKHMISQPNILSIETHGKYYTNPNIKQIMDWAKKNNYVEWYKDDSDTIFVKKGTFFISTFEKLQLIIKKAQIALIKMLKPIKQLFKKK